MQLKFFNPIYISGLVFLGLSIVISIIMICVSFKKDNTVYETNFYTITTDGWCHFKSRLYYHTLHTQQIDKIKRIKGAIMERKTLYKNQIENIDKAYKNGRIDSAKEFLHDLEKIESIVQMCITKLTNDIATYQGKEESK